MELASRAAIPEPPIAVIGQLSENPRLGFGLRGSTLHQGAMPVKYLNGIRDSTSVAWNSWQMSLKAQQQNNDNTLLAQNNPPPPPGALPGTTSGQQPATTTESGINPNYKLPSFDSVLKTTSDFSAGAGDFLSGGLTTKINNATGASSVVDTNSGSYKAGVITGVGLTVATSAAGAVTSQAVGAGKYGMVYGRGGNALLNSGKVRFGWYWTGARDAVGLRIGEGLNTLHIPFWHP